MNYNFRIFVLFYISYGINRWYERKLQVERILIICTTASLEKFSIFSKHLFVVNWISSYFFYGFSLLKILSCLAPGSQQVFHPRISNSRWLVEKIWRKSQEMYIHSNQKLSKSSYIIKGLQPAICIRFFIFFVSIFVMNQVIK